MVLLTYDILQRTNIKLSAKLRTLDIKKRNPSFLSIEDLEQMMDDAIANEEYEIAAELRDRIQMLKDKQ